MGWIFGFSFAKNQPKNVTKKSLFFLHPKIYSKCQKQCWKDIARSWEEKTTLFFKELGCGSSLYESSPFHFQLLKQLTFQNGWTETWQKTHFSVFLSDALILVAEIFGLIIFLDRIIVDLVWKSSQELNSIFQIEKRTLNKFEFELIFLLSLLYQSQQKMNILFHWKPKSS